MTANTRLLNSYSTVKKESIEALDKRLLNGNEEAKKVKEIPPKKK